MNFIYASLSQSNIMVCGNNSFVATIHSPFSSPLIMSNFSSVPIIFCRFSTWIALSDVDLHFSFMLVRETNAVEEATKCATWLYHQCNQSLHMTDGMTVTSLSASLLEKLSVAMYCLHLITLNWKLSHQFERSCKFSSHIKMKPRTIRPACNTSLFQSI